MTRVKFVTKSTSRPESPPKRLQNDWMNQEPFLSLRQEKKPKNVYFGSLCRIVYEAELF